MSQITQLGAAWPEGCGESIRVWGKLRGPSISSHPYLGGLRLKFSPFCLRGGGFTKPLQKFWVGLKEPRLLKTMVRGHVFLVRAEGLPRHPQAELEGSLPSGVCTLLRPLSLWW